MSRLRRHRHPRVDDPIVEQPADLALMQNRTQFVIDPEMVRRKWQEMESLVASVIAVDPSVDGEQCFPLGTLFQRLDGVSIAPPRSAVASCRGGRFLAAEFTLHSEEGGKRYPFMEALHVDCSVQACVEAVYLAFHLPTRFPSWNRRPAADHALLLDDGSDWTYFPQGRGLHDIIHSLDRPSGIRVCKRKDRYYVSCLTAFSNGGIVDRTLRICEGSLSILPSPDVVRERTVICEQWI